MTVNYCCMFCYRTFNLKSEDGLQTKFFRLLKRHFLEENIRLKVDNPIMSTVTTRNEEIRQIVLPCPDCSQAIRSYCEYYEQIELLQMKMNWRLCMLINVIKSSEGVTFRRKFFKEEIRKISDVDGTQFMKDVKNFRLELVKKVNQRMRRNFPRVRLKRHPRERSPSPEKELEIPTEDSHDDYIAPNNLTNHDQSEINESSVMECMETDSELNDKPKENEVVENVESSSVEHIKEFRITVLLKPNTELPAEEPKVTSTSTSDSNMECEIIDIDDDDDDIIEVEEIQRNVEVSNTNAGHNELEVEVVEIEDTPHHSNFCDNEDVAEIQSTLKTSSQNEIEIPSKTLRPLFKCRNCSKRFALEENFNDHERTCESISMEENEEDDGNDNDSNNDNDHIWGHNEEDGGTEEYDNVNSDNGSTGRSHQSTVDSYSVPYLFMRTKFKCSQPNCNITFFNQSDLDNHSNLHGTFTCSFCPVTKSYAPNLAEHELTEHGQKNLTRVVNDKEFKLYSCVHCNFSIVRYKLICIDHHVSAHMNLIPDRHTCPVCFAHTRLEVAGRGSRSSGIGRHYKTCHDVSRINFKKTFRCDFDGCPAYFLKAGQLEIHKKKIHIDGENNDEADEDVKGNPVIIRVKIHSKS